MRKGLSLIISMLILMAAQAQKEVTIRKKDRRRDVLIQTNKGDIVVRLSDSTPLHRDNFLKLVKQHYYDSLLFHRVMEHFMIQGGDPNSKVAKKGQPLGNGGPEYKIPAEFRPTLFHKRGVIAAARMGDDVNPEKVSNGSQFYIVQGRVYSDFSLDSVETYRLKGRKLPLAHREVYKTLGGAPHLDQGYTIFGEVVKGMNIIDSIAATPTSKGNDRNRPLVDVRIEKMKLVRRRN
jgi:cyclophilin family peptidyl-prolyl cis-trans isomerase